MCRGRFHKAIGHANSCWLSKAVFNRAGVPLSPDDDIPASQGLTGVPLTASVIPSVTEGASPAAAAAVVVTDAASVMDEAFGDAAVAAAAQTGRVVQIVEETVTETVVVAVPSVVADTLAEGTGQEEPSEQHMEEAAAAEAVEPSTVPDTLVGGSGQEEAPHDQQLPAQVQQEEHAQDAGHARQAEAEPAPRKRRKMLRGMAVVWRYFGVPDPDNPDAHNEEEED